MSLVYTSTDLINSIRRMGMIPNTGAKGTADADILAAATEIQWTKLIMPIMKIREEYFHEKTRIPLSSNTSEYRLPSRAMLNKWRHVYYWDGSERGDIDFIPKESLHLYRSQTASEPTGFYIEGPYLVVVPSMGSGASGSIEFHYYGRPGSLALSTGLRQVTSVADLATKKITLSGSTVPSTMTAGDKVDIHSQKSGGEMKVSENEITNVTSQVLTLTDALDGSTFGTHAVEVGDWVCPAGEAALPGLPVEYHPLLCLATALRCAVAAGDVEVAKAHASEFSTDMREMIGASESRVEGKPKIFRGRRGILRRGWG